jgi:hypothetical protein
MHQISIDASPHQIRKLMRGHKVRIKKGTGFNLLVHPDTYNIVSRAFGKDKGVELSLSMEELQQNTMPSPEMQTSNTLMQTPTDNTQGDAQSQPVAQGSGLGRHGAHIKLTSELNRHLGTNYGYLSRAGLDNAMAGKESARLAKLGIDARYQLAPTVDVNGGTQQPRSRMIGGRIERDSIQQRGRLLSSYAPPALVSQPFSANWQMQFFLPPQYQHFNDGAGMSGSGLFA